MEAAKSGPPVRGRYRPTLVEVSSAAIEANVAALVEVSAGATVCAVIKADGYGHGAVRSAVAAVAGGATMVAVALVEEAEVLRDAGITGRVMLLSEPPHDAVDVAVQLEVECVVYQSATIELLDRAARRHGTVASVHLKVDTGMHRVGCRVGDAPALAAQIVRSDALRFEGLCTHFATAEDPDRTSSSLQLERFVAVDHELRSAGIRGYVRHAANSAATILLPDSRLDMVRCGIAVFGIAPSDAAGAAVDLRPALRLVSAASFVKRVPGGEPVSYGGRYITAAESTIVTVPVGYADGFDRELGSGGGEVLIRGRRVPIAGTVTMDQITVDAGDLPVAVGDEVVLLGRQGNEEITANEMAAWAGTIGYEVVTRISGRVPRVDRA